MEIKKIKELIKILENSALEEIEVSSKGTTIRLVKPKAAVLSVPQVPQVAQAPQMIQAEKGDGGETKPKDEESGHQVKSPMVGTFYRASAPGAAPFVKEGDRVQQGDVLCIIEAMKTMNKIKCDQTGRIKSILIEDGAAVEFAQPLFVITT